MNTFFNKADIWKSAKIHDDILSTLLSYKIVVKSVSYESYVDHEDNKYIDCDKKEINIFTCHDEVNYIGIGKRNFIAKCCDDISDVIDGLKLSGEWLDSYGTLLINGELLLNNYDIGATETDFDPNGFCDILAFATISKTGIVRYSQIVYSFKFKRLMIRDDVKFALPYKVNLQKDFSGKRAVYRIGRILSLRTRKGVYKKVDQKYHQSDKRKDDLSYPRLQLT